MKQMNLFIIILFCLATSVCAEKKEDAKTNNTEKVCCETFGYGARMIKCCQSYEMVSRDQFFKFRSGFEMVIDSVLFTGTDRS